jgi:hypothetical protein
MQKREMLRHIGIMMLASRSYTEVKDEMRRLAKRTAKELSCIMKEMTERR